jgi:hypothetical protein
MEKISTRSGLREGLVDILSVEIMARDNYSQDVSLFSDQKIVRAIKKIKIDEDRHIALIQFLIKLLE